MLSQLECQIASTCNKPFDDNVELRCEGRVSRCGNMEVGSWRRTLEDNIKMDLMNGVREGWGQMELAQDRWYRTIYVFFSGFQLCFI
jgi:hypothetical protein